MAILIGQTTEGTGAGIGFITEIGQACRFEVLKTGTVQALHCTFSGLPKGITDLRAAVVADEAGPKPKKETVLAEAHVVTPGDSLEYEVTGFSLKVNKGEFVWLVFEQIGATTVPKLKAGAANYFSKSTTKKAEISKMAWAATTEGAPVSFWATGTEEEGTVQVAGSTKLTFKLPSLATAELFNVASKAPVAVTFKTVANVQLGVTAVEGAAKVKFQTKGAATMKMAAAGRTGIQFVTHNSVTAHTESAGASSIFIFED